MKDDIILDKVPLATPLAGVPLLSTAAGDLTGSTEICDYIINNCTTKEGMETVAGTVRLRMCCCHEPAPPGPDSCCVGCVPHAGTPK